MRSQEANALQSFNLVNGAQQRSQVGSVRHIGTVTINNLAEQCDLFDALRYHRAHFCCDISNRAAAFNAASVRNNAVRAGMRAAQYDRDKSRNQLILLRHGQDQFTIHKSKAARGGGIFLGFAFILGEVGNQRSRVRRRRENIYDRETFFKFLMTFYPH